MNGDIDSAQHEELLARAFIAPSRRARWLEGLPVPKRRKKLLGTLAHNAPLDTRYAHRIPDSDQNGYLILRALQKKGAPQDCYLLSEWLEYDARAMSLEQALSSIIGQGMGTIISCLPGRLAYYEAEDMKERYILERCTPLA